MNRYYLLILPALFSLWIAFALILSCGGGGGDDGEGERIAEFTCPDFKLGENPNEPGTAECDNTCVQVNDQWNLEVYRRYVKCIDSITQEYSLNTCRESRDACLERTEKPKKQCAEACNKCLIDSVECEAACLEDDTGCYSDCLEQLYDCNLWNYDCYIDCDLAWFDCKQEAESGLERVECMEDFTACTGPCREGTTGDDDVNDF